MRILVIEDEPRILSFLVRGLEGEGFTVSSAVHGAAGLERARALPPTSSSSTFSFPASTGSQSCAN